MYRRSKFFHIEVAKWLESEKEIPKYLRDQLHRASFSVALNIAEGTARFTKPDKQNFLVDANGSRSSLRPRSNSCHRVAQVLPFDEGLIRILEVLTSDPSTRSLCELAQGDVRWRVVGRGVSKVALRATFETPL